MNLLYRAAASKNGSEIKTALKLKKMEYIDDIYYIDVSGEFKEAQIKGLFAIPGNNGYLDNYSDLKQWEKADELNGDILYKLLPYKDTIIQMIAIRRYDLYYGTYDELEDIYFRHVKFWYSFLRNNRIDVCFFPVIPHVAWEFSIYALARCMNIGTLIVNETNIYGLCLPGTTIENIGNNLTVIYEEQPLNINKETKEIIESYYRNATGTKSRFTHNDKRVERRKMYRDFHFKPSFVKPLAEVKKGVINSNHTICNDIEKIVSIGIQQLKYRTIKYYNLHSYNCLPSGKYVYFSLHKTPEATTLPYAGIYSEQLIGIKLLAEALTKCNIMLVVKEHWVQPCRKKTYYNRLFSIPNVYCINSDIDSYEIMGGAIATATYTGSCITESIVTKKPVITFVDGYWTTMKNVFFVHDCESIIKAIKDIEKGDFLPTDDEVEKYLIAFSKSSVRLNLDYYGSNSFTEEDTRNDICDVILQYCKQGMNDNFVYRRA